MFKQALTAAALIAALGTAGAAHADPTADCRLAAAAIWPNTLDAFENEMRQQAYFSCMSQRQPAAPTMSRPHLPSRPTPKACRTYYQQLFNKGMIGVSGQAARAAIDGCMKGEGWAG